MQLIKGESGNTEKAAFVCDVIMLTVFMWIQIRYRMNMLYLIIPLILIGLYLFFFCIIPEEYCFTEDSIRIFHRFRKAVEIPYETVFNYEVTKNNSYINIGLNNKVKLYYQINKKKKALICRPRNVESFVDLVIKNCPEFHEDSDNKKRIEVFFDNND